MVGVVLGDEEGVAEVGDCEGGGGGPEWVGRGQGWDRRKRDGERCALGLLPLRA